MSAIIKHFSRIFNIRKETPEKVYKMKKRVVIGLNDIIRANNSLIIKKKSESGKRENEDVKEIDERYRTIQKYCRFNMLLEDREFDTVSILANLKRVTNK